MRVTVGDDIKSGYFLLGSVNRDSIDVLLAELIVHHCVKKAAGTKVLGVPAWARQRAGNRGRQHNVFSSTKHVGISPGALCRLVVYVYRAVLGNVLPSFLTQAMDKTSAAAHLSWAVFMPCQRVCYSQKRKKARASYFTRLNPLDPRLPERVTGVDKTGTRIKTSVTVERPLTFFLNGQKIVTAMTIGDYPEYLAIGYLLNQN